MLFKRAGCSLFGKLNKWMELIDVDVLKSMLEKINKNMASGRQLAVVKTKTIISGTEKILYTERKHIKEPRWHWKQIYKRIHNTDY